MDCSEQIRSAARLIERAPAILIGAGAGLSTAAGMDFGDGDFFHEHFQDFADRYGITDEYSGGFYPFPTQEELWAWWSRCVYLNRYAQDAGQPYKDLYDLVQDKDYFVLTTNVDGQFIKAGFDKARVFETQGDFGKFQCATPCMRRTYDNEEQIIAMYEQQQDMKIPPELVPICPSCGGPMTMNLRVDNRFVEDASWDQAAEAYTRFIHAHLGQPILFLEIGVGLNTPQIIKYAFWQMTDENPKAHYILINPKDARFPKEIQSRSVVVREDAGLALAQMLACIQENQDVKAD